MESSVAPALFVCLDEDEAYAGTSRSELRSIVKQMENLKSLKIEDIEPENRDCEICYERLGPSDDDRPSEEPVQLLSCGHAFGHVCLSKWLAEFMPGGKWWNWIAADAYWPWLSEDEFREHDEEHFHEAITHTNVSDVSVAFQEDGQRRRDWRDCLNWDSNDLDDLLPFSGPHLLHEVEARLHFWDLLYQKLGISRSAKEEQARSELMRYVQMVQVTAVEIKPEYMRPWTLRAQVSAMRFALRRGNRDLDPQQTYLRDAIFNLGCYGLHEGEYDAISYENRRVPIWCFQVDRIEHGSSPIVLGVMHWRHVSTQRPIPWELVESSEKFYRELKLQISGSWRRTLFAEVGGDRDGLRWQESAPMP